MRIAPVLVLLAACVTSTSSAHAAVPLPPGHPEFDEVAPEFEDGGSSVQGVDGGAATNPALDPNGSWSILGNGYAQLKNATDAQAAFSLDLLRTDALRNQFAIGVSRGSTSSTLVNSGEFARFLLSPETSSWTAHVQYDRWSYTRTSFVWGWYASLIVGSADWQLAMDASNPDSHITKNVVATDLSGGISLGYQKNAGRNSLRLVGHIGLTDRGIIGDVWSAPEFMKKAIGRDQLDFIGAEAGFWIQLNTVSVGASLPILLGHVEGLTNGQFLPTISVGGKIDLDSIGG